MDKSGNIVFYRVPKDKTTGNYTVVNNYYLMDPNLSGRAKGVFTFILSCDHKKQDWYLYKKEMLKHFKDGKDSLSSAFNELEDNGYLEIKSTKKGRKTILNFTVYEIPKENCADIPLIESISANTCADSTHSMRGFTTEPSDLCAETSPLLNTSLKILTTNNKSDSILRKVIEDELELSLTADFYSNFQSFLNENHLSQEDGTEYIKWIYSSKKNQVQKIDSFIYKVSFEPSLLKEFLNQNKETQKHIIRTEPVFCTNCKRELPYTDLRQGYCSSCGTDINYMLTSA